MSYRIAGIDVHKRMLAVVVSEVEFTASIGLSADGWDQPGATALPGCLAARTAGRRSGDGIDGAILEAGLGSAGEVLAAPRPEAGGGPSDLGSVASGAGAIEPRAAGAQERFRRRRALGQAAGGQRTDLELGPRARTALWRTVMRTKYQVRCNQVQLHNRLEALLEETQIKLSSLVSDLLGVSGRRIRQALAEGEKDPAALAALADRLRLRASPEQLRDALGACHDLHPVYRRLVKTALEEWQGMDVQIRQLEEEMAALLRSHQD